MFILGYNFRQRPSVNNGFVVWKHISYGKLAYRNTINEVKIRNTTKQPMQRLCIFVNVILSQE